MASSPPFPGFATPADAQAGTRTDVAMSPARVTDALTPLLVSLGVYTPATANAAGVTAGATTDTSFTVAFDIAGTQTVNTVGLVVSTNADLSNPVFTSPDVAPALTTGRVKSYVSGKVKVTGLTAGTRYYYAPRINGAPDLTSIGTVKTAPTPGTAASFRFVFGSCTLNTYLGPNIWPAIQAEGADFFVHIGDIDYSNITVDDPTIQRDVNVRAFRAVKGVRAFLLSTTSIYMFDDHDSAQNDNHYDLVYPSLAPNSNIIRNSRGAIRETWPLYPTVQDGLGWTDITTNILSQVWNWGRCRFIMPDLRSQRRYAFPAGYTPAGPATVMGNGLEPPNSWDQLTWFKNALTQAATDGVKVLFLNFSSTWRPLVFDSYQYVAPMEQKAICDAIRGTGVSVILLHGDSHQCYCDDGTNSDLSSTGDVKFPVWCSSPFNQSGDFDLVQPCIWNGAQGDITGAVMNGNCYLVVDVTDPGGSGQPTVKGTWKGNPINGTTGAPTVLRTVSTADVTPAVSIEGGAALRLPNNQAGSVRINKSWFGPLGGSMTGCSVNWSTNGGQSGTVTFGPNQNAAYINLPYSASNTSLTLSGAVNCALGSNTQVSITYYALQAETTAYVNAMTAPPGAARVAVINDLISALKSAGVWTKLSWLRLAAAHNHQAALLNVVAPSQSATETGNIAYTVDRGVAGNGTTGLTTFGWDPLDNGGSLFTQNSNHIGTYTSSTTATSLPEFGNEQFFTETNFTDGSCRLRNGSTTTNSVAGQGGAGHFIASRSASASYVAYKAGASIGTVTQASTALTNTGFVSSGYNNAGSPSYSARTMLAEHWGAALTATDASNLYNALHAYMQALGAAS